MDPRVATLLKWTVFGLIALVAFAVGSKHYKKHSRKKELVTEMKTLVSDASFYRSLSEKDAAAVLLRGVAKLEEAKSLGMEPAAYFDRVYDRKKDLLSSSGSNDNHPTNERLARETLTRAHQHAVQLELLGGEEALAALAEGEIPDVSPKPVIGHIIDPAISPGLEKVVPNLELRPAAGGEETGPNDIEIAAARRLAGDLVSARVIDYEAEKRIIEQLRPKKEEPEK